MSINKNVPKVCNLLRSFGGAESEPTVGDSEFLALAVLAVELKKIEATEFGEMESILAKITQNLVKIASTNDKQKYLFLVQAEIIQTLGLTPDQKTYFMEIVKRLSDQVNNGRWVDKMRIK